MSVLKNSMKYEDAVEYFEYRDGDLYWKKTTTKRVHVGDKAGSVNWYGYQVISLNGVKCRAHRIVWLLKHGYWPENYIDHIDGNTGNNRIENLREVSQQCNLRNSKLSKNNTSGVRGVYFYKATGGWTAHIRNGGVVTSLGYFKTKLEAVRARYEAEKKFGWPTCSSNTSALNFLIANGEAV